MPIRFVISCEHGGNQIPHAYQHFFHGFESLLNSHRGYDFGASQMAKAISDELNAPLFVSSTSRLLIDLNRSISHPNLFSEVTRGLPSGIKRKILARYYLPYRNKVETSIAEAIQRGIRVIHISSHSFTPELNGEVRKADIGLLYDPSKCAEQTLCQHWQKSLKEAAPDLIIRRNYPYSGKADGFTAYLRRRFSMASYAGIELEINQKYYLNEKLRWKEVRHVILETLSTTEWCRKTGHVVKL